MRNVFFSKDARSLEFEFSANLVLILPEFLKFRVNQHQQITDLHTSGKDCCGSWAYVL